MVVLHLHHVVQQERLLLRVYGHQAAPALQRPVIPLTTLLSILSSMSWQRRRAWYQSCPVLVVAVWRQMLWRMIQPGGQDMAGQEEILTAIH